MEQNPVEIKMSFPFLAQRDVLDIRLLLQVDDYASYDLVARAAHLEGVFKDKLSIKFHYKIFKNTSLEKLGRAPAAGDQRQMDEAYIGSDLYFVLEKDSDKKSNSLFLETTTQMCLERLDRAMYHLYMELVRNSCFVVSVPDYNYVPVARFEGCAEGILAHVLGSSQSLDKKVDLTRAWRLAATCRARK